MTRFIFAVFPNVDFDWHVKLKARGKEKENLHQIKKCKEV